MKKHLSLEERRKKVQDFLIIHDVFFEVFANKATCQEILRTILDDETIVVEQVITQRSLRNLYGRSVRLDVLCILGDGRKVNIEVQRSDNDDHVRRVRFNSSIITACNSYPGEHFKDIDDITMIYITEFDLFNSGHTIYHVHKTIEETGNIISDGMKEIYVNTECNDGSKISRLMKHFKEKMFDDKEFPEISKRMYELKNEEGGINAVCDIMKMYEEEAAKEAAKEATEEANIRAIKNMLRFGVNKEQILTEYGEELYNLAVNSAK